MTAPERNFRPEIQALRAVAVALVLAFHLFPDYLTGGYIGVDVFFVISGFLITDHLMREAVATGRISLARFWARRIRRLLPAATFVLAASLVGMFAFVPRSLWQQTVTEVGASALYVQNWVLGFNAVDYLAEDNVPTLVQHYWSLSVEEQFYIAWPIILLIALAIAGRRMPRRAIAIALGVVLVASLAYSIIDTARSQPFAYFNTGTRAWEFAIGGLLSLIPAALISKGRPDVTRLARIVAGWLGLGMIALAAVWFDGETAFPGALALIPVLGTALVILGGTVQSRWSTSYLAEFAPVQVIGDLSYGIYLWHWPLIIVAPTIAGHSIGWKWKLAIVVLSIGLAWLTKRFIEDPVRFGKAFTRGLVPSFALAAGSIAVLVAVSSVTWTVVERGIDESRARAAERLESDPCFGALALNNDACENPFAVPADLDTAFAAQDGFSVSGGVCTEPDPAVDELRMCEYGELDNPTATIAIIGNSHASHLLPAVARYGDERGWKVVVMSRRICLGVTTEPVGTPPDQSCLDWSRAVQQQLHAMDELDLVIFASYRTVRSYIAPKNSTDEQLDELRDQIADTYRSFIDDNVAVVVVGDTPSARSDAPECVDRHRFEYDPCVRDLGHDPTNLLTEAAEQVPEVTYLDPRPWFCDATGCHSLIGGVVVYFDNNHMTGTYSRSLAPIIGPDVEKALAR